MKNTYLIAVGFLVMQGAVWPVEMKLVDVLQKLTSMSTSSGEHSVQGPALLLVVLISVDISPEHKVTSTESNWYSLFNALFKKCT